MSAFESFNQLASDYEQRAAAAEDRAQMQASEASKLVALQYATAAIIFRELAQLEHEREAA